MHAASMQHTTVWYSAVPAVRYCRMTQGSITANSDEAPAAATHKGRQSRAARSAAVAQRQQTREPTRHCSKCRQRCRLRPRPPTPPTCCPAVFGLRQSAGGQHCEVAAGGLQRGGKHTAVPQSYDTLQEAGTSLVSLGAFYYWLINPSHPIPTWPCPALPCPASQENRLPPPRPPPATSPA